MHTLQVRGYLPIDASAAPAQDDTAAQQAELTALTQRKQQLLYELQRLQDATAGKHRLLWDWSDYLTAYRLRATIGAGYNQDTW